LRPREWQGALGGLDREIGEHRFERLRAGDEAQIIAHRLYR